MEMKRGLFLLFQLQNETSNQNKPRRKYTSTFGFILPSLLWIAKRMFHGHGQLMRWYLKYFSLWDRRAASWVRKAEFCQAGLPSRCDDLVNSLELRLPSIIGIKDHAPSQPRQHRCVRRGMHGSVLLQYSKPKSILLPRRKAKGIIQTWRKQMSGQLQDEKNHIQGTCL